ncbi:adenylate cyclase [Candidatus Berkelbacteria bacterium CG10_big_fil_rev_8_21_14_0_10_43_13]|uniref:Adenylate cyclase n=1 Tax=Candidatus Berkelbacteria bacterium CG10_big_fil_rev_8_21_14_0_10_43_13 TaxID=1974514 RepID=A0A2H0W6L9_9BACT|nr:MAG: adenylate cyclase [Candidatus Berkelbacteria bacterium CG10_big_fil_rev_8_21_14_0_10_43_13]
MKHTNIEIKARCTDHKKIRSVLKSKRANFNGTDHQIDTYFKVNSGRLKLREGNIENFLIYYDRKNENGPKMSKVTLYKTDPDPSLKEILIKSIETLVIVDKKREIYFIDNVKFHIDTVKNLGTFVEIEAIDQEGIISEDNLRKQCQKYLDLFTISKNDLISCSYSDMLLESS